LPLDSSAPHAVQGPLSRFPTICVTRTRFAGGLVAVVNSMPHGAQAAGHRGCGVSRTVVSLTCTGPWLADRHMVSYSIKSTGRCQ
jgi:hypothetical protein